MCARKWVSSPSLTIINGKPLDTLSLIWWVTRCKLSLELYSLVNHSIDYVRALALSGKVIWISLISFVAQWYLWSPYAENTKFDSLLDEDKSAFGLTSWFSKWRSSWAYTIRMGSELCTLAPLVYEAPLCVVFTTWHRSKRAAFCRENSRSKKIINRNAWEWCLNILIFTSAPYN